MVMKMDSEPSAADVVAKVVELVTKKVLLAQDEAFASPEVIALQASVTPEDYYAAVMARARK